MPNFFMTLYHFNGFPTMFLHLIWVFGSKFHFKSIFYSFVRSKRNGHIFCIGIPFYLNFYQSNLRFCLRTFKVFKFQIWNSDAEKWSKNRRNWYFKNINELLKYKTNLLTKRCFLHHLICRWFCFYIDFIYTLRIKIDVKYEKCLIYIHLIEFCCFCWLIKCLCFIAYLG